MRGKIVLTAFVVFGFVLAGCNTMAGMGKDVSRAGNAITNAAEVSRRPPRPLSWTRPQRKALERIKGLLLPDGTPGQSTSPA